MSDNQYPVFESGQTLTAADLNMVRAFLHERDRLVARMAGFGINCGLGGVVAGTTLTIKPGLAVDQLGEPLVLTAEQTISLPPTAMTPSYDFITTSGGVGGFSVVLEATDTVVPTPDCGEADCAGHADLHTRAVTLRTVAGRVTGTRLDFAGETLLGVEPIRLTLDSTPDNSYTTLRNAIANRLTNSPNPPLVDPPLIAKLQATSIASGDTAGIKGYKAGWLNMVLFATLDLLRAQALMKLACDRTTSRPGVVLGWVHQVGTAWVFDCAYRHAWEPPRGLSEAFFGGTCSDPLSAYRDELEALLAGFAPPDPAPSGPVGPPDPCKGKIKRPNGTCVSVYFPPLTIPDRWYKLFELDELGPRWRPPDEEMLWANPWIIYETAGWDFFEDGVIDAGDYVGRPGTEVKNMLDGYISETLHGVADVKLVTADKIEDLGKEGYLPAGGFSPSDSIVLTVDGSGQVVATGRVPAVRNTRNVGNALPAAVNAATEAKNAANELRSIGQTVEQRFTTLNNKFNGLNEDFGELRGDFDAYKGGTFDQGGFGARLVTMEQQFGDFKSYGQRISMVEGKVDVIQKFSAPEIRGISPEFGRGLAEFTKTTVAAMRSLPAVDNANFQRYTDAAEKSHTQFEAALATEDPQAIASAAVALLGTVRTMVKASGASPELGKQLDEQLRNLGGMVQ